MKKMLRKIRQKMWYDQKKAWDGIAFPFFSGCKNIIDVGCGEGRFITQDPNRITGLDWNEVSLNKCKSLGYNVIKGDVRQLPFENSSVDGIHCSHVIEHFHPQDVHKILCEFDRVLMPRGILIIRSPLLWKGFYSDLTHIRPYNPKCIIKYLTPSLQRTYSHISVDFKVKYLKWRHREFDSENKYILLLLNMLNRLSLPFFGKTGYMLVLKKTPGDMNR